MKTQRINNSLKFYLFEGNKTTNYLLIIRNFKVNAMQESKFGFKYNVDLPEDIETILNQDFWMLEDIGSLMLQTFTDPVKFSSAAWIFVKKGHFTADISLIKHDVTGPAFLNIENSQILEPGIVSEDFQASVIVMSKRFRDNLFMLMSNMPLYTVISRHPVVTVPEEMQPDIDKFFMHLRDILKYKDNPYLIQALLFQLAAFMFESLHKCYAPFKNEIISNQGRMSDQFLMLAQQNFKQQRFLDFYAKKLEVTPKHLSRTVKNQTGYSAVEWIERFVILEAKVLLKSSTLNIQQISDELNFPSQSFFGKYFKKLTGMSPKEFRNT